MHFSLVILAAIYGTLNAQTNLVKAPPTVIVGNVIRVTEHITEPQANALGYKLVIDERPTCASNEYAVATGYEERGSGLPTACTRIYRLYEKRTVVPPLRKFSKLKIYGAIISLPESNGTSAWEKVQAWLEAKTINGVNGWMAFQLAQEISEDHPMFSVLADEARQLLGLSIEQFETLLNSCILEG